MIKNPPLSQILSPKTDDFSSPSVSIIIVNYNTKQLLADCLASIYAQTKDISFEVIVSDNGSSDDSVEMIKSNFPAVRIIENNVNWGFGKANNIGLSIAKGKYIFYLNSDTILLNNAIKLFFDYWESHSTTNIGGLGCNLLKQNGEIAFSYDTYPQINKTITDAFHTAYGIYKLTLKSFFRPISEMQEIKHSYTKHIGEVESIIGAALFLKNDEFAQFDEFYFMYCEETDLEYTLHKQGKHFFLIEGPEIIHLEGGSRKNIFHPITYFKSFSALNFMMNRIYFFKKNGCSFPQIFILKLLTLLIWVNPFIFGESKNYILKMLKI